LLAHLTEAGFDAAPRFLGVDDQGRISLSYIGGTVPPDLGLHNDEVLRAAAGLIRRYHEASVGFFAGSQVACHNDLSPCNFVFVDDCPVAIIDFDAVAPGTAEWDLGYAAWLWLDIGNDEIPPEEQLRRLELFARAYHPELSGNELVTAMIERQRLLAAEPGDAARQVWASKCLAWTIVNMTT
jgi:thiamine kinase-like enzyme